MRAATPDDIGSILLMGAEFAAAIGEEHDNESIYQTAIMLMDSPNGVLLIDKGAMAGALIYPHFFNQKKTIAQELFWWVSENKRGTGAAMRLLIGLEEWAKESGASSLTMIAMHGLGEVGKIYERKGYKLFEQTYVKEL